MSTKVDESLEDGSAVDCLDDDLVNWEYYTRTYDHGNLFQEHDESLTFHANAAANANTSSGGSSSSSSNEPLAATRPLHEMVHLPTSRLCDRRLPPPQGAFIGRPGCSKSSSSSSTKCSSPCQPPGSIEPSRGQSTKTATFTCKNVDIRAACRVSDALPAQNIEPFRVGDPNLGHSYVGPHPRRNENDISIMQSNRRDGAVAVEWDVEARLESPTPCLPLNEATRFAAATDSAVESTVPHERHRYDEPASFTGAFTLPRDIPHHVLCKPLTAYNYFYRDEKDNILQHTAHIGAPLPETVSDFGDDKFRILLYHRWYGFRVAYIHTSPKPCLEKALLLTTVLIPTCFRFEDPLRTKRQHRKAHGKITFTE